VIEAEVVPVSQKEGVTQIVWSPLAQGVLTGKYLPGAPPLEGSRATGVEAEEMSWLLRDEVLAPVNEYAELCRQAGYTPAAVALAWTMRSGHAISIPESGSAAHVRENAAALSLKLTAQDLADLDRAFPA